MARQNRLVRSADDRVIAGVAGGLAEYFGLKNATVVRLFFVLLALSSGFGGFVYILLWLVMPREKAALPQYLRDTIAEGGQEVAHLIREKSDEAWESMTRPTSQAFLAIGQTMMIVGVLVLSFIVIGPDWLNPDVLAGLLLIVGGIALVVRWTWRLVTFKPPQSPDDN